MKRPVLLLAFNCLVFSTALPVGYALSDEELLRVRDGFGTRRDQYLAGYIEGPLYEIDEAVAECTRRLQDAYWIWYPGENGRGSAPVGMRSFQRELMLPLDKKVVKAYCAFAADNFGDLYLNGNEIGRASGFRTASLIDITRLLEPGTNVLSTVVSNAGDQPNPAGLIGVVAVEFDEGPPLVLRTDDQWWVRHAPDTAWQAAETLGRAGISPWGDVSCELDSFVTRYVFSRLTFALAALSLQIQQDQANTAILEAIQKIRAVNQSVSEFGLHWMGGVLYRIYGRFGPGGTAENRLDEDTSDSIWHLFANWARSQSKLADANPEQTWHIWGSENHSAQRDASAWAAARMIAARMAAADPRRRTYRYDDGSTADEQIAAWRRFLKRYFRERIKRGMLVEISPSGYGSRTLQGWHNIHDFTDDPELKTLAQAALDVWWAEWAQEQLDGMRGGGKTRLYPGVWALSHSDRNRAMSWFYLGQGWPAHQHETLPVIATTEYRLPLVVMDIALDPEGRGEYACQSRRLGRHLSYELSQSLSTPQTPSYVVDPEYGGIVRYSYCTPDFIMGTLMLENRPTTYWTNISQQNRWHGVIFAGRRDSVLYPRCLGDRSTYNEQWSIQNKGTLIAQKLRSALARDMRICFSKDLEPHEDHGWIFARAARAFAAVKVVQGAWHWDDARWLRLEKEYSPVIIEVTRSQDYDNDFESFKSAVVKQTVELRDGVLQYRGLGDSGNFTFYTESDRTPELNGKPIDFAPDFAFDSPFMKEAWTSGVVHIQKDRRSHTIDVREREQ